MKVAICDDEELERNKTKEILERLYHSLDFLVDTFSDGKELLKRMQMVSYDL